MTSSKPQAPLRRFLTISAPLCALALASCATASQGVPIPVPPNLAEPCKGFAGPMATVGDLAAFVLRQEAAVQACEVKRSSLVDLIGAANKAAKPPSLIDRLRGKR